MKLLDWIEEILCVLCTAVMTILVFANVLSRYLLHYSLSFSDEITTYLFILLSMMGTAIAAKRRAHLGLSIITDAVSPSMRKTLLVLGFAIGTLFSAALFYYGILMVINQYNLGMETSAMQWPEWIYGTFIPFGAFFVTIRFAQATIQEWKAPLESHRDQLDHREEAPRT
ncbi:TRAP transporter small permease [Flavonifractor sp. An100]|uniref:TRAP transporter small permease n=1 Tax=Flavonifractor sp. An100 TaxID=1965538 RepID=UPI000B36890E|nr:TRAP transporter small permease [Flavonifractor sp. An100]OUQ78507.1 TRAP transporter permease DctQ [Flavonifractor sp. An100]